MASKIHIPAKRIIANGQDVIKITPDAYKALAEVCNESGRSIKQVASLIIIQAVENDLIVYDREEE